MLSSAEKIGHVCKPVKSGKTFFILPKRLEGKVVRWVERSETHLRVTRLDTKLDHYESKWRCTIKRLTMPLWITFCLILAAALPSAALDAAEDAQTILSEAIKAHGGEARLAKLKIMSSKAKGTVNFGSKVPFTQEIAWQWPDRLKNRHFSLIPTSFRGST